VRTTEYSLPAELHDHVEVVQPTTSFGTFKQMKSTLHFDNDEPAFAPAQGRVLASTGTLLDAHCNVTIDTKCLNDLYNINYVGSASTHNSIATANYLEEYINTTDLNNFFKTYVPAAGMLVHEL
jgi:tripeptidyl-peptidase-1